MAPVEKIHAVECDVFAPCALGGVLNETTIPELHCEIVCGAANNQLADEDGDDEKVEAAGVLFVPDFVANAGGVINIADELEGYDRSRAEARIRQIFDTTLTVLDRSATDCTTPRNAAERVAEARIDAIAGVSRIRTGRLTLTRQR